MLIALGRNVMPYNVSSTYNPWVGVTLKVSMRQRYSLEGTQNFRKGMSLFYGPRGHSHQKSV